MTDQHPITPSIELVKQWSDRWHSAEDNDFDVVLFIAIEAARWGADQELEACCELTRDNDGYDAALALRADRRSKPLSLKEQALTLIDECTDPHGDYLDDNALSIIRRALEQLDD